MQITHAQTQQDLFSPTCPLSELSQF